MADSAQGTVDSLLGNLANILNNETLLVRSVHSEVQFIKDEMESMYGFLLHVEAEGGGGGADHQVRAWTKQVKELANGSQECVDKYVASVVMARPRGNGFFICILKMPIYVLKTLPARRRIASQIRELRVRVQEVGERRLRYGVEIPRAAAADTASKQSSSQPPVQGSRGCDGEGDAGKNELEDERRSNLVWAIPTVISKPSVFHTDKNIRRVSKQLVQGARLHFLTPPHPQQQQTYAASFKVFCTLSSGVMRVKELAKKIMEMDHCSVKDEGHSVKDEGQSGGDSLKGWFGCITYVSLRNITSVAAVEKGMLDCMWCSAPECKERGGSPACLLRRKMLVFVEGIVDASMWSWILEIMYKNFGCEKGSAIVRMAPGKSLEFPSCSVLELIQANPMIPDYLEKASGLLQDYDAKKDGLLASILARLCPRDFRDGQGLKMFLHFLYAKPTCTREDLIKLHDELKPEFTIDNVRRLVVSCFDELPINHYQSCLMYLTTFQHCQKYAVISKRPIRRERATKQWVFHGLLSVKDDTSAAALREADRCFDALLTRGFIIPNETSSEGKVKTFEIPELVMEFLLKLRSTASTGDSSYDKWRHHDKVRELSRRQSSFDETDSKCFNFNADARCCCWINFHPEKDFWETDRLIQGLLASPQIVGVQVLDIQGCKGLKKRHLRVICTTMIFLKYLSIRDTDIEELPRGIEKLNYLEMLDIRQTKIRLFIFKAINVKHLLAGNMDSRGSFSTLILPSGIGSMSKLEVLSHVQVPKNNSDITEMSQLPLRKLGLLLHGNEEDFRRFLRVLGDIGLTLQSLSIRIEPPCDFMQVSVDDRFKPPVNLQSLSIYGIKCQLPNWMHGLEILEKVTLQETYLPEDGFTILGELPGLRKLRIHEKSFSEHILTLKFEKEQFKSLKFLLIDCPKISGITFSVGAAPEAQKIVWSFAKLQSISGVEHLPAMKEFQLKGYRLDVSAVAKKFIHQFENKTVFKEIGA